MRYSKLSIVEMIKTIPDTFHYEHTKKYWDIFLNRFIKRCIKENKFTFKASFLYSYSEDENNESISLYGDRFIVSISVYTDTPTPFTPEEDNDNFCLMVDFNTMTDSIVYFERDGFENNLDHIFDFIFKNFN